MIVPDVKVFYLSFYVYTKRRNRQAIDIIIVDTNLFARLQENTRAKVLYIIIIYINTFTSRNLNAGIGFLKVIHTALAYVTADNRYTHTFLYTNPYLVIINLTIVYCNQTAISINSNGSKGRPILGRSHIAIYTAIVYSSSPGSVLQIDSISFILVTYHAIYFGIWYCNSYSSILSIAFRKA